MKRFWLAFIIGFICGLFTFKSLNRKPLVTHEHIKTETVEQKAVVTEVQQVAAKERVVTKKVFHPSGKVKSETTVTTNTVNLAKDVSVERYSLNVLSDVKKTEEEIQKNILFGVSHPVLEPFNYQNLQLTLGYRMFLNFYIFGQVNLGLSTYSIGILTLI